MLSRNGYDPILSLLEGETYESSNVPEGVPNGARWGVQNDGVDGVVDSEATNVPSDAFSCLSPWTLDFRAVCLHNGTRCVV